MRSRTAIVAVIAIATVTIWRVAATHRVFSPTWDEPAHIYAGYQYLADHKYSFDRSHPPLARIAFAFPLRHATSPSEDIHEIVGDVLTSRGDYMSGVVAARRGNLLFLVMALLGLAFWCADLYGARVAVLAVALFAALPPVLAHAGLATTDFPVTAAFAVAMMVLSRWVRAPDWRLTAWLALAVGAGLVTKFSFSIYFGIAAVITLVAVRRWPLVKGLVAVVGAMLVVWGVYFFRQLPRFFTGFAAVMEHNEVGHPTYFLGEVRSDGWWEYFPTILAIKSPLPFLLLATIGAAFILRERQNRYLLAIAAGMLAIVMFSRINLGVRHVLPIYVPLSIVAAVGIDRIWRTRSRWIVPALAVWLVANSVTAHPDYLPWMNALAGKHPERVVLDSNFDWGQDVLRLRDACRRMGIPRLGVGLVGTVDLKRIGMPPTQPIDRAGGGPGWYAVSEGFIIPAQVMDRPAYRWLTSGRGFRRIGRSIRLYEVRPAPPAALVEAHAVAR